MFHEVLKRNELTALTHGETFPPNVRPKEKNLPTFSK